MIDRRKPDYEDYYWILLKDYNQWKEGETLHQEEGFKFYPNQYIFEKLCNEDRYVIKISPVNKNEMHRYSSFSHAYTSTDIVIDRILELFSMEAFEELWNKNVEIFKYTDDLISFFSTNGYYRPLAWLVEKCMKFQKDSFDKDKVAKDILLHAIPNNNSDLIDYITHNLEPDLSIFESDNDIMTAISKLIANQEGQKDFCYDMIDRLLSGGIFKDSYKATFMIQMYITMCSTIGHTRTSDRLEKFLQE